MIPRSVLFLAVAFTLILAVVADGSYGNDYGNKGNYGNYGNKGNYGNNYRTPHYQALKISKQYSKGVIIGKVPALCDNYGAYWDKCAGDHYFQTEPIQPRSNNFYLRFTAFSGNSKGYTYNKNYKSCSEARDNVAVEYKADGSDKWTTIAILKADHYRNPKTASYKICLYGDPCKVTFRFRSLEDCQYENDDYGVWSFADLKVVTYSYKYGDNYGDDHDNSYGDDRDDHYGGGYGGGYGDDYDDDDKHDDDRYGSDYDDGDKHDDDRYGSDYDDDYKHDDDRYGGDYDDDDKHYGGGNYGSDNKDC